MRSSIINEITSRFSVASLVIANVIPLIGVLFFDWGLFQVMFLFWLESGVIGFYNIFKLIRVSILSSILLVPFFIVHYGGFMAVHLVFIFALFAPDRASSSLFPSTENIVSLLQVVAIPLVMLFISHGISFFTNFISNHEYERTDSKKQMSAPYKRIVIMHLTLIFGGWLILVFDKPILGLVLLIAIKTIADLYAHIKEHGIKSVANP
jgi:hypothetical protein